MPPLFSFILFTTVASSIALLLTIGAFPAGAHVAPAIRDLHRRQASRSQRVTPTIRVPARPQPTTRQTTTSRRQSSTQTRSNSASATSSTTPPPTPATTQDTTRTTSSTPAPVPLPTDGPAPDNGKIDESSSPPAWSDRIEIVPAGPDAAGRPITINAALAGQGQQEAIKAFLLVIACLAASFVAVAAV